MLHRSFDLFKLTAAIALLLLLLVSASGDRSSCGCYYTGGCIFDEEGTGYQYYECTLSCYRYSGYRENPKCWNQEGPVIKNLTLV